MKKTFFLILLSFCFAVDYQSILFRRDGGGNFYFDINLVPKPQLINIRIIQYNFKPLEKTFYLESPADYKYFNKLLKGKIALKNKSVLENKHALTGTWLNIYLSGGNELKEIKDEEVIDHFKIFEGTVKARL